MAKAGKPAGLDDPTGLNPEQKKLILSNWSVVKTDVKTHGLNIFTAYLKLYPEYLKLFHFDDDDNADLKLNKSVQAHVINVMTGLGIVIENGLPDPAIFKSLMHKLGKNHLRRNVQTKQIEKFCEQIMSYLMEAMKLPPPNEQAWKTFLAAVVKEFSETLG